MMKSSSVSRFLLLLWLVFEVSAAQSFSAVPPFILRRYSAMPYSKDDLRMPSRPEALTSYLRRREMSPLSYPLPASSESQLSDPSQQLHLQQVPDAHSQRTITTRSTQEDGTVMYGQLARKMKPCRALHCRANLDSTINTLMTMMEMGRRK
ncbi:uncharacterized protein [Macrobrachium rosenbergii]|uniref:uncharacterized protein n=1 Tax=Macrobrachium rosenbergii TaxID=79674 RepID=UPI0034D7AF30